MSVAGNSGYKKSLEKTSYNIKTYLAVDSNSTSKQRCLIM
jgi:hypothetical protein